jgi:arylsulfatase B
LVNDRELYNIKNDPGQQRNVIDDFPEEVARLREFYDATWSELEPTFAEATEIYVGDPKALEVNLTAHDWIGSDDPPWNQQMIRQGRGYAGSDGAPGRSRREKSSGDEVNSYWAVKVVRSGEYEIECSRWPEELAQPLSSRLAAGSDVPGANRAFRSAPGKAIPIQRAELYVDGKLLKSTVVSDQDTSVRFRVRVNEGSHRLIPVFVTKNGEKIGAYYASIKLAN